MAKTLDREANESLDELRQTFGLSESELADLFGIRRPSLTAWREEGVPQTRRATLEELLDLARVLHREVIPTRIPEIVRRPDDWLDGRSILQTVQRDGTAPVYGYLRRLFAYTPGA